MANIFTLLNVCEVISYSKILQRKDDSHPTALEIWHYSSTGELSKIWEWFHLAEIHLGLRKREEVEREYVRIFKATFNTKTEERPPFYQENINKVYKLIETMDLPDAMKIPIKEEDFASLKRNLPIRNIAHVNYNEVMQLIYSILDVLEKDDRGINSGISAKSI